MRGPGRLTLVVRDLSRMATVPREGRGAREVDDFDNHLFELHTGSLERRLAACRVQAWADRSATPRSPP